MKPYFIAVLALFSASANAGIMPAGPAVEVLPGGGWRMLQPTSIASIPASTRTWEMAGPGMQAVSKVSLAGKAGPLPVNVTRVMPWGLLGTAIARSLPIVGAVAAVADLAQAIRMKQIDGDLMIDVGAEKSNITGSVWGGTSIADSQLIKSSSPSSACSALAADWAAKVSGGSAFVVSVTVSSGYYQEPGDRYICRINRSWPSGSYSVSDFIVTKTNETYQGCPSIPAGVDVIEGSDGRCPTGRYDTPASVYLPQNIQKVPAPVLKNLVEALDARPEDFYPPGAQPPAISSVTGPSSQSAPPQTSTTTGPAGQVSTTINTTYNYIYNGDTITYTTKTTTTTETTTPDGEKKTEVKEDVTNPEPPKENLCDLYPESLACLKVGTPPDPEALPQSIKPVNPGRHSAWSYNSGQCPNRTIDFSFGVSVNILQPFCDFFVILKGVILSIFSLASALVFRGGIR